MNLRQEYDGRVVDQKGQSASEDRDLALDVPSLGIEELNLDVENLRARISLQAELADMVKVNVGVEADVDKAILAAKGVDAQVLLKIGLDNVRAILSQALDALDNNPGILEDLIRTSEETSGGALQGQSARPSRDTPEQRAGGGAEDHEPEDQGAGEPGATDAARRKAEELGINLSQVEGTGAGGRILVGDVRRAAR